MDHSFRFWIHLHGREFGVYDRDLREQLAIKVTVQIKLVKCFWLEEVAARNSYFIINTSDCRSFMLFENFYSLANT